MLFAKSLVLFVACTASANLVVVERANAKVASAYGKFARDVQVFIQKINTWDGTITGVPPIHNAAQDLQADIKSLTNTIAPLKSCPDSSQAVKLGKSTFVPNIANVAKALVGLKGRASRFGPRNFVESDLEALWGVSRQYGSTLVRVACAGPSKGLAQGIANEIETIFDRAIPDPGPSAFLAARTPAQILADLGTTDSDVKSLTSTINSWDGSLGGSLPIQNAEQKVEKDLNATIAQLRAEPVASCADIGKEINYVVSPLEPDIRACLNALVAKKAKFVAAGLGSTIRGDLQRLKTELDQILTYFINAACASQKSNAQSIKAKIDQEFQDAINAFSSARVKRTPAQVLASLKSTDADCRTATSCCKNWDGTINGGVTVQNCEQKLEKDIDAVISILSKEPQASSADSKSIISYIQGTLIPDICAFIDCLISQKSKFVAVGLKTTVQNDLKSLKAKADALADALIKAASSDQKANAQNAKAKIDACINRGIGALARRRLLERTPAQVLASIKTIDSDTKTLTSSINSWDGSASGAIVIQNNEQKIEKDLDNASAIVSKEPQASSADSKTLISYVGNPLVPDICAAVNALIAKKSQYTAAGLKSTVQTDLKSLKAKFDQFCNGIVKIASSDQKTNAQNVCAKGDACFQKGLSAYARRRLERAEIPPSKPTPTPSSSPLLAALKRVDDDFRAATSSTNSWDGTINGGVTIQNAEQRIEKDTDAATSIASKLPQMSSADSKTILTFVTGTYEPDLNAFVTALINQKGKIIAAGLKSTFQNDLKSLKTKQAALCDALIKSASNDQKSAAQSAKAKIDADLNRGISAYARRRLEREVDPPPPEPLPPSSPSTLLGYLKRVDADFRSVSSRINSWDGTPSSAVAIQNAEQKIEQDINAAASFARSQKVYASPPSQRIINYLNNHYEPDLRTFLDAFVAKKSQFTAAGLKTTAQNDLKSLRSAQAMLGAGIVKVASQATKATAQAFVKKADDDLVRASRAFA